MINPAREQEILRRRLLSWGLECEQIFPGVDLGRDLKLTQGSDGLDFARVESLENLHQDLSIALTTLLGSDIFNTQFGFDGINAMAEETNPVMVRERIRIAIIKLLRKDPRIRRIVDIKLEDNRLDVPVSGNRELNVKVAFETISGDRNSIDLGKVISNV